MIEKRLSWDEYFMKLSALVAERSTCRRHHIGAVIVKDKRIITTGYNGAAKSRKDCIELGCVKDQKELASGLGYEECRAIHAEQNAIVQGSIQGISVVGGTLYCTHTPCMICAKLIVQVGIKRIVSYQNFEGDRGAKQYLEESGVELVKIPRPNSVIGFKD